LRSGKHGRYITAMFDRRGNQNFHPRSPVQPDRSPAPYFIAAIVAAIAIWSVQQQWAQDSNPPVAREAGHDGVRSARGDVRTVFSADDYPVDAQRKGEEGTVQAKLDVDTHGRVSRCTVIRSSGSASLDGATCRILQRRARFAPARDVKGKAVGDTYVTPPIKWQLEG
jgi:protein TonB